MKWSFIPKDTISDLHAPVFIRIDHVHQNDRIEDISVQWKQMQNGFQQFDGAVTGTVDQPALATIGHRSKSFEI